MKKIFFISILMILSETAFSQLPVDPPVLTIQKSPASVLKVYNYTKCTQYFLIAGLANCDGCNQNQEDYLTEKFYEVLPINEDGTPGYNEFNAINLFGEFSNPAFISHVKIPHGSPPQCAAAQIDGGTYCLTAPVQIKYQSMIYCEINCYTVLATWKPAINCEGTAYLTFTEP